MCGDEAAAVRQVLEIKYPVSTLDGVLYGLDISQC